MASIRIPDASAEMIVASAEAVYYTRPSFDITKVMAYLRATQQKTAEEALKGAALIGLVIEKGDGTYESNNDVIRLEIHADDVSRKVVFRHLLEKFEPFRLFKERVFCGDSPLEAAEKVKLIAEIETDSIKVKETFQQWGLYTNSFLQNPIGLVPASSHMLTLDYLKTVQDSLSSNEQAGTFIARRLGDEVFHDLSAEIVDSLAAALTRCQSRHEPRQESIFAMGTAVEKVLSVIASKVNPPVDISKASGIGQITDTLRSANIITKKHVGLLHAIGAIRNCADHGVDNEIGKVWVLTYESILDIDLLALDTIRSLINWLDRRNPLI